MKSFEEVGKPENAEAYVRDRLERHEKIFGFGHAVYKTYDPRATVLKRLSQEACERAGEPQLHEIAEAIEKATFEQKGLYPNVDFYAAAVFHVLGIPTDLMTPVFAAARMAGWTAHVREQYADNKVIRPGSRYVGPPPRTLGAGGGARLGRRRPSGAGRDRPPRRPCGRGRRGRCPSGAARRCRRSPRIRSHDGERELEPHSFRVLACGSRSSKAASGTWTPKSPSRNRALLTLRSGTRPTITFARSKSPRGRIEVRPLSETIDVVHDLRPDDVAAGVELRLQLRGIVRIGERHVGDADQVARRIRDLRARARRPLVADPPRERDHVVRRPDRTPASRRDGRRRSSGRRRGRAGSARRAPSLRGGPR